MPARKSSKPRPVRKPVAEAKPRAKAAKRQKTPAPVKAPKRKVAAAALTVREQKIALRGKMRASLAGLRGRAKRSEKLCDAICDSAAWRRASVVAIFAPMESACARAYSADVRHWGRRSASTECASPSWG